MASAMATPFVATEAPSKMDMEAAGGMSFTGSDLDGVSVPPPPDSGLNQWTPTDSAWDRLRYKVYGSKSSKDIWIGSYSMKYLCTPQWPYCNSASAQPPAFFGRDAWLGILVAIVMGLQHALAMLAGLITPPLLISYMAFGNRADGTPIASGDPVELQRYLIQAALIVAGIMTFFQVLGLTHSKTQFQWGAGILSVMGVSFTTVPIAESVIGVLIARGYTFEEAYGKLLGTLATCAIMPILYSFMPVRVLKKLFPPVVTGITVCLIGLNLVGTGMMSWGGGANCIYNDFTNLCTGNGDVHLLFGSGPYVGLGFMVFGTIVLIEIFGSPFMRNASVALSLLLGYAISSGITYEGKKFVTTDSMASAPAVTFLWTTTFPLGFYAPAVIPLIIVFSITSIESIGDTTASRESSHLSTTSADPEYNKSIRGALLNDSISGIFSALSMSLPMTTYAQNNGVIALTNVASRQAGFACAAWLFGMGVIGKTGAWVSTIPNCVLGGMTTFLFANLISSGIKLIMLGGLTRRTRFIMGCSFCLGVGVTLYPQWATNNMWPDHNLGSTLSGIREAVELIMSTGFVLGAVVSFLLNLILPQEAPAPIPATAAAMDAEQARVMAMQKAPSAVTMLYAPSMVKDGAMPLPSHAEEQLHVSVA